MAKYSVKKESHREAKRLAKRSYPDIFESYEVPEEDNLDFRFILERELTSEEWSSMPEKFIVYNASDGVFEGDFR